MRSPMLSLKDSMMSSHSVVSRMTGEAANILTTSRNFSLTEGELASLLKNLEQRSVAVLLTRSSVLQPASRPSISDFPPGRFCLRRSA